MTPRVDALLDKLDKAKSSDAQGSLALIALAQELERELIILRTFVEDLRDHGTRHDCNPTMQWSCEDDLHLGYLRHIKSMDDSIRDRAAEALPAPSLNPLSHELAK